MSRAAAPEPIVPDAVVPDAVVLDAVVPDAVVPDAVVPDAVVPDAGVPDAGVPDAGVPDAVVPDAGVPGGGGVSSSVFFSVLSPDLSDFASDLLRPFASSTAPAAARPRSTTSTTAIKPTGRRGGTANDSDAPASCGRARVLLFVGAALTAAELGARPDVAGDGCWDAGRTSEPGGGVDIGAAAGGGSEGGAYETGPGGTDDGGRDATFPCG